MKKLKNQTGLVQNSDDAKSKVRKGSKVQRKRRELPAAFKAKQYKAKSFPQLVSKGVRPLDYTTEELKKEVSKLAAVANKRLKRLEKAGRTQGAYKHAKQQLATQGREKFSGASKDRNQLTAEFIRLRSFLSGQTSTAAGYKEWEDNRYRALLEEGFTGSKEELSEIFQKYWTKELEQALGSDVAFVLIKEEDGRTLLQDFQNTLRQNMQQGMDAKTALADALGVPRDKVAGEALGRYLERF